MSASNIGLANMAAMAVLVAIVAVNMSQGAVPNYVKQRCDGRYERIEDIKISSCPTGNEYEYCEVEINSSPTVELTFTPLRDYDEPLLFTVRGPRNGDLSLGQADFNPCEWGVSCPLKANRTEKIVVPVVGLFNKHTLGRSVFNVHPAELHSDSIYCIEWLVDVV